MYVAHTNIYIQTLTSQMQRHSDKQRRNVPTYFSLYFSQQCRSLIMSQHIFIICVTTWWSDIFTTPNKRYPIPQRTSKCTKCQQQSHHMACNKQRFLINSYEAKHSKNACLLSELFAQMPIRKLNLF